MSSSDPFQEVLFQFNFLSQYRVDRTDPLHPVHSASSRDFEAFLTEDAATQALGEVRVVAKDPEKAAAAAGFEAKIRKVFGGAQYRV